MNASSDLFFENLNSSGSGESSEVSPFAPYFPCRTQPYSKDSVSPFVWNGLPQLEDARWYVVAIESVFLVVGLAWNLFVIACYIRNPKLLKQPASIYLFTLAITDILISILVTFTTLTAEAAGEFVFGFSDFSRCISCKFFGVSMHLLVAVSLHTLAALSIDRFVLLTQPIHYRSIFTWKRAVLIEVIIWAISIVVAVPPLYKFGDYEYNLAFAFCNGRWTGENGGTPNFYYILFYSLEALIPIFILMFTNIWIVKIAKKVLKQRITRQRTFRGSNSDADGEESKYRHQQKQLIRVFGALFIAHIVCWAPVLTIMFVALGLGASNIPLEAFVAGWLAFLTNPVIHPILETFFVKELRYRMNKTKKNMRSSLKRASSTLHSQMSSTSLTKRPSRTSLDPPPPSATNGIALETTPAKNLECAVDFSYMKDQAFGQSAAKSEKAPLKKRKSTVSFMLDCTIVKCAEDPYTPVFDSPNGPNFSEEMLPKVTPTDQNSPTTDMPNDDNIEAGRTEE